MNRAEFSHERGLFPEFIGITQTHLLEVFHILLRYIPLFQSVVDKTFILDTL